VTDPSGVGEARRTIVSLAESTGFDETACGASAVVVAEAANNLIRHAEGGGGEILFQATPEGVLDIAVLDKGPGMASVAACLRDGYSTAGTSGNGLGAIARLSPEGDVFSRRPSGTVLWSRFQRGGPDATPTAHLETGAFSLTKPGETACGDAWAVSERPGRSRILVADGLGHGPQAAEAAAVAVRVFHQAAGTGTLCGLLEALHAALHAMRGATVLLADVDYDAHEVRCAGLGNVAGAVVSPNGEMRHMVSLNGTAGHQARRFQEFSYPLPPDALVVMASDGLTTQWRLDRYPGLATRHPALIAALLYRDFVRGRGDATALVARQKTAL